MPATSPPSTILVTGANGFVAAHCIAHLLSQTFTVIGTVRSSLKATSVLASHYNHPSLTILIVPDITLPGCFNEAIKGCDAVLHLAAPFAYSYEDFERDLLKPSIQGTLAICEAATREKSVKRVVLTSSFASVYDASKGPDPGKTYTEKDWCPLNYDDGKNATATPIAYRASKVLAEKTAWEFLEKNKAVGWDLVTLCPGMVFGALVPGTIGNLGELNTSNGIVWGLFGAEKIPETRAPIWTSVTALATAHTKALITPGAGNQRFLLVSGEYDLQELADILHTSPAISTDAKKRIPNGEPGKRLTGTHYKVNGSKAERILKLETPSLESTVVELTKQLLEMERAEKV